MDAQKISKILQRTYFWQLAPVVVLVGLAYLLKQYFHLTDGVPPAGKPVNIITASLAGIVGIALPIFYRSYFVHKIRDQKKISTETFIRFEKTVVNLALLTPYFLVVSLLLNMAENTNIIVTLLTLYTAYYYFPSARKMQFEMKIFRIKPTQKSE